MCEYKIAHFTSLSPSKSKRLSFSGAADEMEIDTVVKSAKSGAVAAGDDNEDSKVNELKPQFDKSFEKAVDWSSAIKRDAL